MQELQEYLEQQFVSWQPAAPTLLARSRRDITLCCRQPAWNFLAHGDLLYRLERADKLPRWALVYSGGKSEVTIDNLAPSSPHRFRLRVVLRAQARHGLAVRAAAALGGVAAARVSLDEALSVAGPRPESSDDAAPGGEHRGKWLESRWSETTSASTEADGTSAACFCMAVRGGYLRQVQLMLEEKPALIEIINPTNGLTPLATAVWKGDAGTARCLLAAGADPSQPCAAGRVPLHLAALGAHVHLVELLLERGADSRARDVNALRVEHYAVDSGSVAVLRVVLDRGGDVTVRDSNGWTPLFRAVVQGADTAMIEELVQRGSEVQLTDRAGLALAAAARLLTGRHGRARESVLRLVDVQFPREQARAHFTKLTKKIASVHTLLKQ